MCRYCCIVAVLMLCLIAHASGDSAITPAVTPDVAALQSRAESGDPSAQLALARAYETGRGVAANDELATKWYLMAAQQGNAIAQNEIGVMYRTGRGVTQDRVVAVQWYAKAAAQGLPAAQFNLAVSYYNGDGVGIDDQTAYILFVLAKEAGSRQAEEAVVRSESEHSKQWLSVTRRRLAKVRKDAIKSYESQAQMGNGFAMYRIAKLYESGSGLKRDEVKAYMFYRLAEMRQIEGAKDGLEALSRKMDKEQLAKAEKKVQQWR